MGLKTESVASNRIRFYQHGIDGFGHQYHGLITAVLVSGYRNYEFHAAAYLKKHFKFGHIGRLASRRAAEELRSVVKRAVGVPLDRIGYCELRRTERLPSFSELLEAKGALARLYSIDNAFLWPTLDAELRQHVLQRLVKIRVRLQLEPPDNNCDRIVIHIRRGDALKYQAWRQDISEFEKQLASAIPTIEKQWPTIPVRLHTNGDSLVIAEKLGISQERLSIPPTGIHPADIVRELTHAKVLVASPSSLSLAAALVSDAPLRVVPDSRMHCVPQDVGVVGVSQFLNASR